MENKELEKFKLDFFGNKLWELLVEKVKTIILVTELALALLVIAGFSEKIIPESSFPNLKIIIIILLSLIPVMLVDYILELNDGINSFQKQLGLNLENGKKWYLRLIDGSNYLYILSIIIIIDFVIYVISQSIGKSIIIVLIQFMLICIFISSKKRRKHIAS